MRGWLLDTNVLSELVRPSPNQHVITWLRQIPEDRTYVSILTLGEIDQGIESLAPSDSRRPKYLSFRNHVEAEFSGRILSLEDDLVRSWGVLSGQYRRANGGKAPVIDTMLVATAQKRRLYLATRNVVDMRTFGWSVFNPWSDNPIDFPLQV